MNTEINAIINSMQEVLSGEPWYGKSVLKMLEEIDDKIVYKKPNDEAHSLIELLYHMVTWAEFVQHRLERDLELDMHAFEALDWRETNPETHTWHNGISQFTAATNKTIELLKTSSDEMLEEKVDYREYDFRFLLNGIIQHNIYHVGQIAYLNKLLSKGQLGAIHE